MRNDTSSRQTIRGSYLGLREAAPHDLIGIGREEKPINQNDGTLGKSGRNLSRNQLRARGHEEKSLGGSGDLFFRVKQDLSDCVANGSAARLSHRHARHSDRAQTLSQQPDLRRLARPFSTFEDNEFSACPAHSQERVIIGLAAPFFMPSIIH